MVTDLQKRAAQAIVNVFETSRPQGNYAAVTLIAGDAGHLTYGRSQTTLGSGNLHVLIRDYCGAAGARFAGELSVFLPRLAAPDFGLDNDAQFRGLLARAGEDPVMQTAQDVFFDRNYWDVAVNRATTDGIASALGVAVVYDSTVHGSWTLIRGRTNETHGTAAVIGERAWIPRYLQLRRAWMESGAFALSHITVFRMDELLALVNQGKWELELPFRVRGILIDEQVLAPRQAAAPLGPSPTSGFMIQSSFGQNGNFELVIPHPAGGLAHCSRLNDTPDFPWTAPGRFGEGEGMFTAATLIQSSFTTGSNKGNLEVVAQAGGQLLMFWRDDREPFTWRGPLLLPPETFESVGGNPALVQARFGGRANFELVVPRADGGFSHFWRDNSDANLPWTKGADVGREEGMLQAVALMESTFTKPGTLEVIARRQDGRLVQYWRDPSPPHAWNGPAEVPLAGVPAGTMASGIPGFIQGRHGTPGNYELVTPLSTGGLAHLARLNEDPAALRWGQPVMFGMDAGPVDAVSLLQSNLGGAGPGNLEVAARGGGRTLHYWRQAQPPFEWSAPGLVACSL